MKLSTRSSSHRSRDEARPAQQRPQRVQSNKAKDGTESALGETKPLLAERKAWLRQIPMRGLRIHERYKPDPETGVAPGFTRCRNMRSRCRCSMCPAIHINSRSWLRSSSTHEPSDPPLRVVSHHRSSNDFVPATERRRKQERGRPESPPRTNSIAKTVASKKQVSSRAAKDRLNTGSRLFKPLRRCFPKPNRNAH